jgi:hypothetical protein
MIGRTDAWIRCTTTGSVGMLALIAGTVSYLHMHMLVELHGQPGWVAALTPLSVDGMIVAASTTLLADSRSGDRGGILPWTLLVIGSAASLAANVAVAQPAMAGRVIAAWPSFALIGSYELLMRQVRHSVLDDSSSDVTGNSGQQGSGQVSALLVSHQGRNVTGPSRLGDDVAGDGVVRRSIQRQAWQWALANRTPDDLLPSGREIAVAFGRHERWGRLVKRAGLEGEYDLAEVGIADVDDLQELCAP